MTTKELAHTASPAQASILSIALDTTKLGNPLGFEGKLRKGVSRKGVAVLSKESMPAARLCSKPGEFVMKGKFHIDRGFIISCILCA
jgi:hypothetical protein